MMEDFNCGKRLRELMHEQGWDHRDVARILGRKSISSVSTKIGGTDLKISEITKLMNAAGKKLYEFIISKDELSEIFSINPLLLEVFKRINSLDKPALEKFVKFMDASLDNFQL
ncbi:MAG: helix-turn-helix transcriptional regulator [Spirochaetes bacterium]|nr:helix-turn-helix transcriptional regulator [Spirochaetota bacterium]